MTTALKASSDATRRLVVISGYYGFDNLGDEAILEEIIAEVAKLCPTENIVVLSANPQKTSRIFGVQSISRNDFLALIEVLKQAKLFISGGGGLFQNTHTVGSIIFYGLQVMLASRLGCKIMIFAQGIGPLRGKLAVWLTKNVFALADAITVRDDTSLNLLKQWSITSVKTADPVWCLESRLLPPTIEQQLNSIRASKLVALSLRTSDNFSTVHLQKLVRAMGQSLPANAHVVLLPLQEAQDKDLLLQFAKLWQESGRDCTMLDTNQIQFPSQWISLFGRCRMVIAMRLHALIMSLKAGVPVVGIAYDPKVSHLLSDFEQPGLILAKEIEADDWVQTLKAAFEQTERLSMKAIKRAEGAKKLACQNFNLLDRILARQSES